MDLGSLGPDPKNLAGAEPHYTGIITGHPGDKGMAVIAEALPAGLAASSAPQVFVVSQLLGGGGAVDETKREVCVEDPAHRVYVDLSGFGQDPKNLAGAEPYYTGIITGRPGDKGMAVIAEALLAAMVARGAQ